MGQLETNLQTSLAEPKRIAALVGSPEEPYAGRVGEAAAFWFGSGHEVGSWGSRSVG